MKRFSLIALAIIAANISFSACSEDDDNVDSSTSAFDTRAVDLGLPSGLLWADVNIGANVPEEYGDYFAWGDTVNYENGKADYTWSSYSLAEESSNSLIKYSTNKAL